MFFCRNWGEEMNVQPFQFIGNGKIINCVERLVKIVLRLSGLFIPDLCACLELPIEKEDPCVM